MRAKKVIDVSFSVVTKWLDNKPNAGIPCDNLIEARKIKRNLLKENPNILPVIVKSMTTIKRMR